MIWDQLTSPQLASLDRRAVVLLPLAATEQHGPHLPLATDRLIAQAISHTTSQQRPDKVLVLPCPPVGYSQHHRAFAGTLSVAHDTLIRYAHEMIDGVVADGFDRILMLNAHGGNQALGGVLQEQLGEQYPNAMFVFTSWWRLAADELLPLNETGPGGVGHACEFETSLMLHLHPELVRPDKIEKGGNTPTFDWAASDMLRAGRASLYRSMRTMTPNGIFGDPTGATAEKGRAILDTVTAALVRLIDDLYDHKIMKG